jgi:alanyl-tRNA synthetase
MTTLTARDIPYEIKIRLDANGIRGAQYQTLRQWLREDGSVDQERENDVVPLSLVDDGVKTLLAEVLGEAAATALTQNAKLAEQLEAAQQVAQVDAATLAEAQATITNLQAQIADLTQPAESTAQQRIAARRYQAQIGGTTLDGMPVDTSTDSQALITGAALAAVLDSTYVCRWKMADGTRVELDTKMIIAVASAVRDHIQACYDREDELLTAVADGTFTDAMLDQGWPA